MKKSHKLKLTPEYSFSMIGISSHENDYRLSWALNKALNIELRKTDNYDVITKKSPVKQSFSKYTYVDETSQLDYILIANSCENGYLMEEYKNLDYVFLISQDFTQEEKQKYLQLVKSAGVIHLATFVDIESLKSKYKLIF
ncbi:MAG: IPExxxVDY family protein [Marinilabiliales bacterium]|nr:MAG: IPExxxVDY family protein [Marinilabiliales bacterium]